MSLASEGQLKAPPGKFRVIGVDTFEAYDADYLIGDFDDRAAALDRGRQSGGPMNKTYVYDDTGREISGGFGTY